MIYYKKMYTLRICGYDKWFFISFWVLVFGCVLDQWRPVHEWMLYRGRLRCCSVTLHELTAIDGKNLRYRWVQFDLSYMSVATSLVSAEHCDLQSEYSDRFTWNLLVLLAGRCQIEREMIIYPSSTQRSAFFHPVWSSHSRTVISYIETLHEYEVASCWCKSYDFYAVTWRSRNVVPPRIDICLGV